MGRINSLEIDRNSWLLAGHRRPSLPFLVAALVFLLPGQEAGAFEAKRGVGVFIAQEIRPFMLMVEGLEESLHAPLQRIFLDRRGETYGLRSGPVDVTEFGALVAVGPGALEYLITNRFGPPVVYGMVLNPESITGKKPSACGVSLNLPADEQLAIVRRVLPEVKRLGVLFDPANNQEWFDRARVVAETRGITLVPMAVSESSEIAEFFQEKRPSVGAVLFIPDRTVISEAIIQYVIKEALLRGIPAIGYNSFFYETGAALSFIIDYRHVGKLVARQVEAVLDGRPCAAVGPQYRVWLNRKVTKALGIRVTTPLPDLVEEGP